MPIQQKLTPTVLPAGILTLLSWFLPDKSACVDFGVRSKMVYQQLVRYYQVLIPLFSSGPPEKVSKNKLHKSQVRGILTSIVMHIERRFNKTSLPQCYI